MPLGLKVFGSHTTKGLEEVVNHWLKSVGDSIEPLGGHFSIENAVTAKCDNGSGVTIVTEYHAAIWYRGELPPDPQ